MTGRRPRAGLDVALPVLRFVEEEALPGTGIEPEDFWRGLELLLTDLAPRNRELLQRRADLQHRLDAFHREHPGPPEPAAYRDLLAEIGYLVAAPGQVRVTTEDVDPEIATTAGPQLVVPLLNARFAVNAANARWGSLYDALYGTDAIDEEEGRERGAGYNAVRGAEVVAEARRLLDEVAPVAGASHADATGYSVRDGRLLVATGTGEAPLEHPERFAGHTGDPGSPGRVLLLHHGLHVEVVLDRSGAVGASDLAGVEDVVLESALTTIMDLEDSVAAVDADDKALGYHNWRELMRGTLSEVVTKGGSTFRRTLAPDREYTAPDGSPLVLRGRSTLFVRTVGHLMTTDAVLDASGQEVFEGLLDTVMTALGALPDLVGAHRGANSRTGSMYVVKPKMHGPDEVAFTVELFARVEALLGLPPRTIKVGIMDEERRTSVNLAACVAAAADRLVFVNTGFLDRTGDEIHTSLHAGPVVPKAAMRSTTFLGAYERSNVDVALAAGLAGRAQIGKGMWAMPDLMRDMLEQKGEQVRAGATTAWVPSPTAATLHAVHYHRVDSAAVLQQIARRDPQPVDPILVPPLADAPLSAEQVATELDNDVQSILGYVVRWVDQGVGCSKVPDIHQVALMEDRATLRISSQLLANWLAHGVIDEAAVDESLHRLAPVVDAQNAGDPAYEPLVGPGGPGLAFEAARRLILEGAEQPSGYTEPILHRLRRQKKAELARRAAA